MHRKTSGLFDYLSARPSSGIDMADGYQGVTFGLEIGRPLTNLPNLTQLWRGNFSKTVRF
jgi:hypothetical protein